MVKVNQDRYYEYAVSRAKGHLRPASQVHPAIKAMNILKEWLSPQQLAQYEQYCYFDVTGSHTKRWYRIYTGGSYNVREITRGGRYITDYCFYPDNLHHLGDILLAQKVALETNEQEVLKVANSNTLGFESYIKRLFARFF